MAKLYFKFGAMKCGKTTDIIKTYYNYKEKDLIYDLKDAEDDLIIQCGIAILLDNKSDYERFFSKLSENEKNAFKEFPIYNLLDKEDI